MKRSLGSRIFQAAILCGFAALWSAGLSAQQHNALDKFKQAREQEMQDFQAKRQAEFERYKARYEEAFEKFRQYYGRMLQDEIRIVDLMVSDDGIPVSPLPKARQPKVFAADAGRQRAEIEQRIRSLARMKPADYLPDIVEEEAGEDEVDRMKKAAEEMERVVREMTPESAPEPDPAPKAEPVPAPVPVRKADPAPAAADPSIPSGKPTEYKRISSPFGTRIHPISRKKHTHKGVDLAAPKMTPVYATGDATVTFAGRNGGYGNFIKLNHGNGYKTAYAHLHKIVVRKNQQVSKGDLIGYVGTTGQSTGNHLHYEMYYKDQLMDPAKTF